MECTFDAGERRRYPELEIIPFLWYGFITAFSDDRLKS
jgi:hypothetical protein